MKKFFAVIFLLMSAFLTLASVLYLNYSIREDVADMSASPKIAYGALTFVMSVMAGIIYLLTRIGIKWLRTPGPASSDVIDDGLIGK